MYPACFTLFAGAFQIAVGTAGLMIIGMLMNFRRTREERFLIERFGDAYRKYKAKTGAFIPPGAEMTSGKMAPALPGVWIR